MIAGAHGIKGQVRLRSFTDDPESIFDYKPLTDEKGERTFSLDAVGVNKDLYIVAIKGVKDRNEAEALRGTKLFFERTKLPKVKKGQYYEADLIGLVVKDKMGKTYGKILASHDYGAGAFLEIGASKKDSFMLPFTDACVPSIDVDDGCALINPPDGWLDKEEEEVEE